MPSDTEADVENSQSDQPRFSDVRTAHAQTVPSVYLRIAWQAAPCCNGNFSDTGVVRAVEVLLFRRFFRDIDKQDVRFGCTVWNWSDFRKLFEHHSSLLPFRTTVQFAASELNLICILKRFKYKLYCTENYRKWLILYWKLQEVVDILNLRITNKITQAFRWNRSDIYKKIFYQTRNRLHLQHLNGIRQIMRHCKETERQSGHTHVHVWKMLLFTGPAELETHTDTQTYIIIITTLWKKSITLMHCSLFKFTLLLNSVLPFWKLLVFESLLGISETLLCPMSTIQLKIVLPLDMHQLLMLSAGTLIYLKQKLFLSVILYNNYGTF
jgi:hypothetical protein